MKNNENENDVLILNLFSIKIDIVPNKPLLQIHHYNSNVIEKRSKNLSHNLKINKINKKIMIK